MLGALLRSNPEPLSPSPTLEAPGEAIGAWWGMAHLHPLPPQEQKNRRSNTEPIRDLGITMVESLVPTPISMLMKPSVTNTWRFSSAVLMPQVSAPSVLDSPTVLGTARISQSNHHHISSARGLTVKLTLSLWFHPGGSSVDGFSAIKLTALARPQFLVGARAVTECGGAEPGMKPQMMLLLGQVPGGISNGSGEWAPTACPLGAQDP